MRVLLLAPHPFYQERGTPIAVDLLLRALSERGDTVDMVTYHEGENRSYEKVTIHRIPAPPGIRNVRPGFSLKKIICDFRLSMLATKLARKNGYDVVHAVEESVFVAMRIKRKYGFPYIFDMDSSMPEQIAEKMSWLTIILPLMRKFERSAVAGAEAVVPMCESLAGKARGYGARYVSVLHDISLLPVLPSSENATPPVIPESPGTTFMYIGNLESYQGISLMIRSLALCADKVPDVSLVIAGGTPGHIARYKAEARDHNLQDRIHFLGPQPLTLMPTLFARADILVSPRVKGTNTPMKIYSYLDSGKPVLATDLPTHTQVMSEDVAVLAHPEPQPFADAMIKLVSDQALGKRVAANARKLISEKYSLAAYRHGVLELYNEVENRIRRNTDDS